MEHPPISTKLETRLVITPKDLIHVFGGSYEANRKRLRAIKDSLKKKHISFRDFAKYEGLDYNEVCEKCNIKS